jgi:putative N-acetyltransferase (TIGR04045 family)
MVAGDGPGVEANAQGERTLVCRTAASPAELQAYYAIRKRFFVDAQGLFDVTDIEPIDQDPRTIHIVAICQPAGEIIGVVRCYPGPDEVWFGGRLAVVEEYRTSRLAVGRALVRKAEELVRLQGVETFVGFIQLPTVRFFEHIDWLQVGEPVDYVGRPHQLMRPRWSLEPTLPLPPH